MKKVLISVLTVLLLFPMIAMAKPSYDAQTLEEACESEGIKFDHSDYTEAEDKINIYLFRGSGCSHCYEFLNFLNNIVDDYGKYFNVVSFEVWNNKNNSDLKTKVMEKFNETQDGVPYIVIGEHSFVGYSEDMSDEIKSAIKSEYESDSKYDVLNDSDVLVIKTDYAGLAIVACCIVCIIGMLFLFKKYTK